MTYALLMSENCSMHFVLLTVRALKTSSANDIIWLRPHCRSHPLSSSSFRQTGSSVLDHLPSPDTLWFIANYLSRSIIDYTVILLALLNLLAQEHNCSQGGLDTNCLAMGTLVKMDGCSFACRWKQFKFKLSQTVCSIRECRVGFDLQVPQLGIKNYNSQFIQVGVKSLILL